MKSYLVEIKQGTRTVGITDKIQFDGVIEEKANGEETGIMIAIFDSTLDTLCFQSPSVYDLYVRTKGKPNKKIFRGIISYVDEEYFPNGEILRKVNLVHISKALNRPLNFYNKYANPVLPQYLINLFNYHNTYNGLTPFTLTDSTIQVPNIKASGSGYIYNTSSTLDISAPTVSYANANWKVLLDAVREQGSGINYYVDSDSNIYFQSGLTPNYDLQFAVDSTIKRRIDIARNIDSLTFLTSGLYSRDLSTPPNDLFQEFPVTFMRSGLVSPSGTGNTTRSNASEGFTPELTSTSFGKYAAVASGLYLSGLNEYAFSFSVNRLTTFGGIQIPFGLTPSGVSGLGGVNFSFYGNGNSEPSGILDIISLSGQTVFSGLTGKNYEKIHNLDGSFYSPDNDGSFPLASPAFSGFYYYDSGESGNIAAVKNSLVIEFPKTVSLSSGSYWFGVSCSGFSGIGYLGRDTNKNTTYSAVSGTSKINSGTGWTSGAAADMRLLAPNQAYGFGEYSDSRGFYSSGLINYGSRLFQYKNQPQEFYDITISPRYFNDYQNIKPTDVVRARIGSTDITNVITEVRKDYSNETINLTLSTSKPFFWKNQQELDEKVNYQDVGTLVGDVRIRLV